MAVVDLAPGTFLAVVACAGVAALVAAAGLSMLTFPTIALRMRGDAVGEDSLARY